MLTNPKKTMKKNDVDKKYISLHEVADRLGYSYVHAQTLWPSWAKFGVKAYRMGRKLLFRTDAIDLMLEMHAVN